MPAITRHLKKPWIVMPVVAVLAVGGWYVVGRGSSAEVASTQAEPQVVEATIGTMSRTVSAEGTVAAAATEDLSFNASGTVTSVEVEAGDVVTAGQVLARIDSVQLEADVATAEASVADAEAKLADALDADASDAQIQADEAALTSAQDQLAAANDALDGAILVAGIDGTVSTVGIAVGEQLADGGTGGTALTGSGSGSGASASTLGSGSTTAFPGAATDTESASSADLSIVSTGRYLVELGFDDTDVANLAVGQTAAISTASAAASTFPGGGFPGAAGGGGFGGRAQAAAAEGGDDAGAPGGQAPSAASAVTGVEGFVLEVGAMADASSGVAQYPVTVVFADASGEFNVGSTVSVEIAYEEVEDALQVPSLAVATVDGTSTVTVQAEGSTETRTVETGLTSGSMVQITEGLSVGESVVIEVPSIGERTGGDGPGGGAGGTGGGLPEGFAPPEGFTPPAGFTPPGAGG